MNGREQEIIIPGEYVESIMLPAAEHEAGHVIAAHHHNPRVLGIAVGFIPTQHICERPAPREADSTGRTERLIALRISARWRLSAALDCWTVYLD
jgi:hypothetical protein